MLARPASRPRPRRLPCPHPTAPPRPSAAWALLVLNLIQGIGGLAGGVSLVAAPDGAIMQMPVSYLDGSPFADYLVPGLILMLVLGAVPLVTAVGRRLSRTAGDGRPGIRYAAVAALRLCGLHRFLQSRLEHADACAVKKLAGASVRLSAARQTRVFLTFAAGDVSLVRPLTTQLTVAGGLTLDDGVPSSPFGGPRSEIIRASLLARLRHCAGALCLYRPGTLEDEWVLWSLTVAQALEIPLLRSPLSGDTAGESERILADLGAVAVPLRGEAIIAQVRDHVAGQHQPALDVSSIAETLHLMRHPLR